MNTRKKNDPPETAGIPEKPQEFHPIPGADIACPVQTKEALLHAITYNRGLIEASLDPLVTISRDGTITDVNAATVNVTGCSREELIGTDFSRYFTDPKKAEAGYQKVFLEGQVTDYELEIRHRNGKITPVLYNATVYYDESGSVAGIFAAARDISRRKEAEDALKVVSEYSKTIIEHSPVMIWHKDTKNTFVSVNPAYSQFYGKPSSEMVGKTAGELFPGIGSQYYRDDLEVITSGKARLGIIEMRKPADGPARWVRTDKIPLRNREGTVTGVLAFSVDITEHKQAEDLLRKFNDELENGIKKKTDEIAAANLTLKEEIAQRKTAEETLRQMLSLLSATIESTADGILVVDCNGRITSYNHQFALMWNIPDDPVLQSHNDNELLAYVQTQLKDPDEFLAGIRELRKHPKRESFDVLQFNDGRVFERFSKPQMIGDTVIGRVWSFRDITERKRAENVMRQLAHFPAEDPYGVLRFSRDFDLLYTNAPGNQWLGTLNWNTGGPVPEIIRTIVSDALNTPGTIETEVADSNGHTCLVTAIRPKGEDYVNFYCFDITERKNYEEKIGNTLREKEVLIREIHHRVKNNLQIISSLLDMTRMRTGDTSTSSILTDMMMKIQAMAQIHTRLYESKQFDRIDMDDQIQDQVRAMANIYSRPGQQITFDITCDHLYLPVDQAIPLALVVNELISNTYKHAFKGRPRGTVGISLVSAGGQVRMVVRDDGVGLPDGLDINTTGSLGLKLIRTLVQHQLRGSLTIISRNGTEVIAEFPLMTVRV